MKKTIVTAGLLLILSNFSKAQTPNSSTTEKNAITVVQSFLDAVKEKSHAKANVLLDPQIEWDQPGNNRTSGIKKTPDEVFKMFGIFFKISAKTLPY